MRHIHGPGEVATGSGGRLSLFRSTTILGLTRNGTAALGGDGQVTFGATILKANAHKTRRLARGDVLAGFAGSAADGLQLFERFEARLETFHGNLRRAAVELAKEWRTDRVLRRLDAQIAAVSTQQAFIITGSGEVIEPDDGIVAIGSGGPYALAACRALLRNSSLSVAETVRESLRIAGEICIYTGSFIELHTIPQGELPPEGPGEAGAGA